jgi:hypothetical protein
LITLAGVVLVGAAIMLGFLFLTPEAQACANGPDAHNPTVVPGVYQPTERQFETIAEAERWICHSVAYPRSDAVKLERVSAFRSGSLQQVVEGDAYAEVRLSFRHASGGAIDLTVAPFKGKGDLEARGRPASSARPSGAGFGDAWQADGLDFQMRAERAAGFTQADFDAIKESIR